MPQFQKKPIVVYAFAFSSDTETYPDWFVDATKKSIHEYGFVKIRNAHEGLICDIYNRGDVLKALDGYYIVKEADGYMSVYASELFLSMFSLIES